MEEEQTENLMEKFPHLKYRDFCYQNQPRKYYRFPTYDPFFDLLDLKCSQLEKYVQLRRRESKNYQEPDTGITFSALEQRVNNFYDYDLAKLRSYIRKPQMQGFLLSSTDLSCYLNDHLQ